MPAPLTPELVQGWAARLGLPLDEAMMERAERVVEVAVEEALTLGSVRLDILPPELEQVARARWRERVQAGDSSAVVLSGTSGLPLSPIGGTRGSSA